MALINYNPKTYIIDFTQDLIEFAKENNEEIKVNCIDTKQDLYEVIDEDNVKLFTLDLDDIILHNNNQYQGLKLNNNGIISNLYSLLVDSEYVKIITKTENFIVFIVLDEPLISNRDLINNESIIN
jgi:hypothetical protein